MKGGVGAGGSWGDDPWARAGDENGNGIGNGKAAVREVSWRERENNRNQERLRRVIARRIFAGLRMYGNYTLPRHCDNNEVLKAICEEAGWTVAADGTTYRKGPKPPAGDQQMSNIGGSAPAPVNPGGASFGLTRASSPLYPNIFASSSNSKAPATPKNGSPPSSQPRLRKMARLSSQPADTPPLSPVRISKSNVPPPPWATGAAASRFSFQTSTPPLTRPVTGRRASGPDSVSLLAAFPISNAAANKAPAYSSFVASGASLLGARSSASASAWKLPPLPGRSSSWASAAVRGRGATLMNPLGFSFPRSGGEQQAGAREELDLELTLGNAETRKDRA